MKQATFFPVAGCAGTDHRLAGDYHHRWMVIDAQGEWLTGKVCPALQQVSIDLKMGALVLRAPGMLRMDIPLDVIEDDESVNRPATIAAQPVVVIDEGEVAAVWFSKALGQSCRFVKIHPDKKQPVWP
jgi:uncharacterized protein YcbX